MLSDNVITKDIAKRILSGESLFLIDNNFITTQNNDFSITKIMGGDFDKPTNKTIDFPTNFNSEIESTKQSKNQIDCWLLSGVNALVTTDWGKIL